MSKLQLVLDPPNNEKQESFLAARTKHIGYGGARGGGKSWAVRNKAKRLCMRYNGIKCLIIRRTYPELINNHITPLQDELPIKIARYNKTDKIFKFFNGSTIKFGYCNNDNDLLQYQGAEYDIIFIDEFKLDAPKTKEVQKFLDAFKLNNKVVVVTDVPNADGVRAANNIQNIELQIAELLSTYDVVANKTVVLTKAAVKSLEEAYN